MVAGLVLLRKFNVGRGNDICSLTDTHCWQYTLVKRASIVENCEEGLNGGMVHCRTSQYVLWKTLLRGIASISIISTPQAFIRNTHQSISASRPEEKSYSDRCCFSIIKKSLVDPWALFNLGTSHFWNAILLTSRKRATATRFQHLSKILTVKRVCIDPIRLRSHLSQLCLICAEYIFFSTDELTCHAVFYRVAPSWHKAVLILTVLWRGQGCVGEWKQLVMHRKNTCELNEFDEWDFQLCITHRYTTLGCCFSYLADGLCDVKIYCPRGVYVIHSANIVTISRIFQTLASSVSFVTFETMTKIKLWTLIKPCVTSRMRT